MQIIEFFYLVSSFIGVYLSMVWLIVYMQNRKTMYQNPKVKSFPSVTFLIPAYNEGKHIGKCIKSILSLDYPKDKLKVIVIDDGSTDNTAEVARSFRGVEVISKKNEGSKAAAMNYGMKFVKTELIACMDADSEANSDYLKKAVGHFENDKIGAVSCGVKTRNITTLASKIQWVEYLMSVIFRKLFAILDCQFVVPGPGGVYRTNVLRKVGEFDVTNLTEDMEMALRLQTHGYKIANCLDAYVYTVCPEDFKSLFKQRMRWYRGYLENFGKYFNMFLNPKYGNFGMFFLPATIAWTAIVISIFALVVGGIVFDSTRSLFFWSLVNFEFVLPAFKFSVFEIDSLFLALSIASVIGLVMSWIGIKTGGNDNVKGRKFFYVIYIITYPLLFSFFWFSAFVLHILGVKRKW